MSTGTQRATLDDLYRTEGKAELIGGRIVHYPAKGHRPARIAGRLFRSLDDHSIASGVGLVFTGTMGFAVPELPSGRESFSPDVSYYSGPLPENPMWFSEGPPTFAVEVRSENDYGLAAEAEMEAKRLDYFQAGTLVVWDVDPQDDTITCYRASDPQNPVVFRHGEEANAEPAVPGWRMNVAEVFRRP